MKNHWKDWLTIGLLTWSVPNYAAQAVDISALQYSQTDKQMRMVLNVSHSPTHRVFVQNKNRQLVIDINNGKLAKPLAQPSENHPLFAKLQILNNRADSLRLVIDLKKPITGKAFSLSSNNKTTNKLIIDLTSKDPAPETAKAITAQPKTSVEPNAVPVKATTDPMTLLAALNDKNKQQKIDKKANNTKKVEADSKKDTLPLLAALMPDDKQKTTQAVVHNKDKIVIAIDAGHGGEDPGAHGVQGTEEKRVVFSIATKLAKLINQQSDMKAVMVRTGDYYLDLRKRMQIARNAHADLFISIHADAFQDNTVKGSSVYVLSEKGASSEAALWLAKSENASGSVAGVKLDDKEDVLASVLLDLSQSATEQASLDIAQSVLKQCSNVGEVHKNEVQKAGFMVLKSPDIPSILVETAFISNPDEEINLINTDYQNKMALAIFQGVNDYFKTGSNDTKVAALTLPARPQ